MILCDTPTIIIEIIYGVSENVAPLSLGIIVAKNVLFNAQGLLNGIAYGVSRRNIEGWKMICCKKKKSVSNKGRATSDNYSYQDVYSHPSDFSKNSSILLPRFVKDSQDEDL